MSVHIHALIVGAGRGSRFGADLPKQYTCIHGKTVLQHTVSSLNHECVDDLTLVVAEDDTLASTLPFDFDKPIYFAIGGAERFLSVKLGLESMVGRGVGADDWVLIHDGARPCLPMSDLSKIIHIINELDDEVGAILATPVADTLKFAKQDIIAHTVSREHLYQAQTPQIFRISSLLQMLDFAEKNQLIITDEASGFEHLGQKVKIVIGSRQNIKLTYLDDLPLIQALLS